MGAVLIMTPENHAGYQQAVSLAEGYPGAVWLGVSVSPTHCAGDPTATFALLTAADCRRLATHLNIAAAALDAGAADKTIGDCHV